MPRLSKAYAAVLRSCVESKKLAGVSLGAEALYFRLLLLVDGEGRFYGDAEEIASRAMLRRVSNGSAKSADGERWIAELQSSQLLRVYTVDGEEFLELLNYWQPTTGGKGRARLFPPPDREEVPGDREEVPGDREEVPGTRAVENTSEEEITWTEGEIRAGDHAIAVPGNSARRPGNSARPPGKMGGGTGTGTGDVHSEGAGEEDPPLPPRGGPEEEASPDRAEALRAALQTDEFEDIRCEELDGWIDHLGARLSRPITPHAARAQLVRARALGDSLARSIEFSLAANWTVLKEAPGPPKAPGPKASLLNPKAYEDRPRCPNCNRMVLTGDGVCIRCEVATADSGG